MAVLPRPLHLSMRLCGLVSMKSLPFSLPRSRVYAYSGGLLKIRNKSRMSDCFRRRVVAPATSGQRAAADLGPDFVDRLSAVDFPRRPRFHMRRGGDVGGQRIEVVDHHLGAPKPRFAACQDKPDVYSRRKR